MSPEARGILTSDLVAILRSLGTTLLSVRTARGLSLREVSRATGVSFSTITRIEHGEDCNLSSAIAVIEWLGRP